MGFEAIEMEYYDDDAPPRRSCWKVVLAVLSFLGFSVTMPPLGFLMFLSFSGIIDKRSLDSFVERITPVQDIWMGSVIFGFATLSVIAVTIQNPRISRALCWLILSLAVLSLGGCVMGLSNLKNIGS